MPPTLGFTNEVAKAQEARSMKQFKAELKSKERLEKYELKQKSLVEKQKIRLKKYELKEMAKVRRTGGAWGSFKKQLQRIGKSVPKQNQPAYSYNEQSLPIQKPQSWNPFAHKSEVEVYGDEGLTLFDGDKRGDDDTGSLFGISRRRYR